MTPTTAPTAPTAPSAPTLLAMAAQARASNQAEMQRLRQAVRAHIEALFPPGREPRSPQYRAGLRALYEHRVLGLPLQCPHAVGTAQADAWFAGVEEARWRLRGDARGV